ncbi:MAG: hypothetical protein ACFFFT_16135 [Candidatus Thorarchaeota archaeon]
MVPSKHVYSERQMHPWSDCIQQLTFIMFDIKYYFLYFMKNMYKNLGEMVSVGAAGQKFLMINRRKNKRMNKTAKYLLLTLGILLLIIGFGNIFDDAQVLVYDLTAIFSGVGFIIISITK